MRNKLLIRDKVWTRDQGLLHGKFPEGESMRAIKEVLCFMFFSTIIWKLLVSIS